MPLYTKEGTTLYEGRRQFVEDGGNLYPVRRAYVKDGANLYQFFAAIQPVTLASTRTSDQSLAYHDGIWYVAGKVVSQIAYVDRYDMEGGRLGELLTVVTGSSARAGLVSVDNGLLLATDDVSNSAITINRFDLAGNFQNLTNRTGANRRVHGLTHDGTLLYVGLRTIGSGLRVDTLQVGNLSGQTILGNVSGLGSTLTPAMAYFNGLLYIVVGSNARAYTPSFARQVSSDIAIGDNVVGLTEAEGFLAALYDDGTTVGIRVYDVSGVELT